MCLILIREGALEEARARLEPPRGVTWQGNRMVWHYSRENSWCGITAGKMAGVVLWQGTGDSDRQMASGDSDRWLAVRCKDFKGDAGAIPRCDIPLCWPVAVDCCREVLRVGKRC